MRIIPALLLVLASGLGQAFAAAQVELFSPQGMVKDVRQVAVRFSAPMTSLGDPRAPEPFLIECPTAGRARWADPRNWVYDFDANLPAGVRCRFTLKPDLRSLAGEPLTGTAQFEFNTGGPAVRRSLPNEGEWSSIDENQIFILALDAEATPLSVANHAYCAVTGLAEKIPLRVLEGQERIQVLEQRRLLGYSYFYLLRKDGEEGILQIQDKEREQREKFLTAVQCTRPLPPETRVDLVWGQGVATPSGIETAQDQTLVFKTRPAFTASFSCERVNPDADCLPMKPMRLYFSAPISRAFAEKVVLKSENGRRYRPKLEDGPTLQSLSFDGPFPETQRFGVELPRKVKDDAGRELENAERFPLEVRTDEYPPLAKFSGEFGILEAKEGGVLPVTLRNLEPELVAQKLVSGIPGQMRRIEEDAEIARWLERVESAAERNWEEGKEITGRDSVFRAGDKTESFTLPKPEGAKAFEVVGIPLTSTGFYVVELASPRLGQALLGEQRPRFVMTSTLVTNMAVHFKWGRESSLVFVTSLDNAQPAADADVRVSDYCSGAELWRGRTNAQGFALITGALPEPDEYTSCTANSTHPLMVSARKDGDLSFTLTEWNRGITPSEFNLSSATWREPELAHTVLDRSLLRAGETVSMKHFLRRHTSAGFALPPAPLPEKAVVEHLGSGQTYEMKLAFDAKGIAESRWEIPREAKLGTYQITLAGKDRSINTGSFRVEQYRVPTMQAVIQPPSEPLVNAESARLDLFVSYLSGGGAAFAPVKLRSQVQAKTVSFAGYDDYRFGGTAVREGIESGGGHGYFQEPGEETTATGGLTQVLPLSLDAAGASRATIEKLPKLDTPQDLLAELEYQDANGELLTVSRRVPLWPAQINVGLRTEGWAASEDELRFRVVALDLVGKPVGGQRIKVEAFERRTHSYRKRLIGGFYAYEHSTEVTRVGTLCKGTTDELGLLLCETEPGISGELVLQAVGEDPDGHRSLASLSVWVAGDDDWWFAAGPSDRMDLLPEKKSYEAGDIARLQVRMPFRKATALVSVEREGVMEAFVTELSGKRPVVELPVKPEYAPNAHVSVLVLRGRLSWWRSKLADFMRWTKLAKLDGGSATALVDLSKPAYRLGMAGFNVGWTPHRLEVKVEADAEVYRIRDKARINISVTPAAGGKLPADAEVAVAAVDEGLLELMPNTSWNLLEAMMQARGIEVLTSTAQMQVVGKRHYGRKAIPPGGGGGRGAVREMFDPLLLWRGRVPLDGHGKAQLEIPLNDALTSFRIVAVANAGLGLFGTGKARIRTTQELQIVSGLPPLVREGDRYRAIFTLRNASERKLALQLSGTVSAADGGDAGPLAPQTLAIDPGLAQEVGWDVTVPIGAEQLNWELSAGETDGPAIDRLKLTQSVTAAYPVRVYQATLTQLENKLSLPVERPADAIPGRGGIRVDLRARLGEGLAGIHEYMSRYPYICIEQKASQAIALRDADGWKRAMNLLPSHMDRDGLVKYFPAEELQGSDALTAYLLAIAHEAGWEIPEADRKRLLDALEGFVAGRIVRGSAFETSDLTLRKLAALEALSRYGTVKPEQLTSFQAEPNLWPTSALLDWLNLLKRVPGIPEHAARLAEALQILRSRLNFQGTIMSFATERDDVLWWLMISSDSNAVRAVLSVLDEPQWREDVPRMLRGALGRQLRGHWNTTVANAWGVLALERFSAAFESATVTGRTEAQLAGSKKTFAWSKPQGELEFAWPEGHARDTASGTVGAGAGVMGAEREQHAGVGSPPAPAALAGTVSAPSTLNLTHQGGGKPWVIVQARAALPLKAPLFTGYTVQKTITPVEQKQTGRWTRGDVARVKLEVDAQSDMTWVVVDDPVPAGASIQGSGLGRDSALLSQNERREGWAWPAYEERRHDFFRAYYALVAAGKFTVEYTVRFNASGNFELPATRVEAMYAPEMFGELPNAPLEVLAP
ncbi:MAG: alpha-2-macroglobulin family protein [Nevskiales bacterium]